MPKKAFKAMNVSGDGKYHCLGKIYELGKTYEHDGELKPCSSGFHCCPKGVDVYNYYTFGDNTEVFEIEIPDDAEIIEHDDKLCVSKFKMPDSPIEEKGFNSGKYNTGSCNTGNGNTGNGNTGSCNIGNRNTGNGNTGNWNTGNRNTGNGNTGNWNTGNGNTGSWNTGNCNTDNGNTGNRNTGSCNTGDWNTGSWNTGDWNTADYQSGFFNTEEQPVSLFNGAVMMKRSEFTSHKGYQALMSVPLNLTKWVSNADLPDDEKTGEYTDGKQVSVGWNEACKEWWANMTKENKKLVQTLPGFDKKIFKEVTGIKV